MKKNNKIKEMADKLCELLVKEDFIVQRYDAYSTDSIYLKIDYGYCNSIRISNHPGKKYLKYMYNLRSDLDYSYTERDNYMRYYYPFKDYKRLVNHIKNNRQKKLDKLGSKKAYNDMINIQKNLNKNNKGFWQKAYLVKQ